MAKLPIKTKSSKFRFTFRGIFAIMENVHTKQSVISNLLES